MVLGGIFKKTGEGQEHYWSLVIGKNWTDAAIWRVNGEIAEIVAEGVPTSWQEGDNETLVAAADSSLSSATSNITEEIQEPNKVVFGLMSSWVEEGLIKKEYLGILKKVSGELELSPAGFVVIPEAIVHYIKIKEGAPLNAILVGLLEDSIEVTLVQSGKILGTTDVSKSISLGSDVAEGLARLAKLEQYPSRILLYDHRVGNLDDARQNILETNWDEQKVSFLHTPKVQILPENIGVISVSLAGGAEVGNVKQVVEVEEDLGAEYESKTKSKIEEEHEGEDGEKEMNEENKEEETRAQDLGFVESDIAAEETGKFVAHTTEDVESHKNVAEPKDFPQVRDKDIDTEEEEHASAVHVRKRPNSLAILGVLGRLSYPKLSFGGKGGRLILIPGIVLLLILVGGGALYWYLPKAQVTVYVAPKKLEKTFEFTVNPQLSSIDSNNKVVPGIVKEAQISSEKTISTTGTKTVGERSKGKVTVLHVGTPVTLKVGTVLSGPSGLKFTLDDETKIATGSSITNPSKAQSTVTAVDIGAQYNLASNSEFSVGASSKAEFVAQNYEAFSGGTSRSVSAVSETDRADLEKDLTAELLQKGMDQIKGLLDEKETPVDGSSNFQVGEKTFSNKVGEESSTVKLTLSGKVTVLVISQNDINSLVYEKLEKEIPQGFSIAQDQVEISYKPVETQASKTKTSTKDKSKDTKDTKTGTQAKVFVATIKANFLPKVDPVDIAKQITGKYPTVAKNYLATIPGYTRAEISFSFLFPGKLGTLPRVAKNISIEVSAER